MKGGIEQVPGPMRRVLRRHGIDVSDARQAGLRRQVERMAETCRACPEQEVCVEGLDAGSAGEAIPEFCPNAGLYALAEGYLNRWRIAE